MAYLGGRSALIESRKQAGGEGVLELSTRIEVTLLSLSQIQHRRRLNDRRHDLYGGRNDHTDS